ncbi:MAG: hypothetical protein HKN70_02080 [Gammaproteobacteria bacterium]|nr:hypothetical protein [Gammaproteobacteria bacterium]
MDSTPKTPLQITGHPPNGRVPITLGVTGHRDLSADSIESVKAQLGEIFQHIRQCFEDTPIYLISALAEGADQLAATIALDHGIYLYAALPMDKHEYRKDFENADSRRAFDDLLGAAVYCKTQQRFDPASERDLCYAGIGKWIVDQSDLLISAWDGKYNGLAGGTGEVVHYALSGELPSLETRLDSKEWMATTRPVMHLLSVRQSDQSIPFIADMRLYETTDALLKTRNTERTDVFAAVSELSNLQRANTFNQTLATKDAEQGYPLLDTDTQKLPDHLRFIHQLYLKSDLVANHFQAIFKRYTIIFYTLTATLMTTLLLYFRIFPIPLVLALYVLIYVVTIVVSIRIRNSDFQRKYHLYRAVGEISRLFFFFSLSEAGRKKRASILNNYRELQYMTRKLGEDNRWFLDALRKIQLFENDKPAEGTPANSMELVNRHWIEDQHSYFCRALKRDEAKLRNLDLLGTSLFVVSLLSGISLFVIGYLELPFFEQIKPGLSATIGISVGLGGILKTYTYTMGLSELTGRYRLMQGLFEHAIERMKNDQAHKDAIFEQLWWEALMENIEWFSLKDSRLISTISNKGALQGVAKLAKLKS